MEFHYVIFRSFKAQIGNMSIDGRWGFSPCRVLHPPAALRAEHRVDLVALVSYQFEISLA
jgi:hypothetical protein